jgi:hypothetical protein
MPHERRVTTLRSCERSRDHAGEGDMHCEHVTPPCGRIRWKSRRGECPEADYISSIGQPQSYGVSVLTVRSAEANALGFAWSAACKYLGQRIATGSELGNESSLECCYGRSMKTARNAPDVAHDFEAVTLEEKSTQISSRSKSRAENRKGLTHFYVSPLSSVIDTPRIWWVVLGSNQ